MSSTSDEVLDHGSVVARVRMGSLSLVGSDRVVGSLCILVALEFVVLDCHCCRCHCFCRRAVAVALVVAAVLVSAAVVAVVAVVGLVGGVSFSVVGGKGRVTACRGRAAYPA